MTAMLLQVDSPVVDFPEVPSHHFAMNVLCQAPGRIIQSSLYFSVLASASQTATELAIELSSAFTLDIAPSWVAIMSNAATLIGLKTQVYNPIWEPQLSVPYNWNFSIAGGLSWNLSGRAQTYNFNFKLDLSRGVTPLGQKPPKHTYIHYGPGSEFAIDNTGQITTSVFPAGSLNQLMSRLSGPLAGTSNTFYPIRIGKKQSQTGIRSWAPVNGIYLRGLSSFRRSRNK